MTSGIIFKCLQHDVLDMQYLCFVVSYLICHVELLNLLPVIWAGLQCFKMPKNCSHTHWLDLCNVDFLFDSHANCNVCNSGANIQISSSIWMSVFLFCSHKYFLRLCFQLLFVSVCSLDDFSLFLSWRLLWSVWASWMFRRNDILKVITCTWSWLQILMINNWSVCCVWFKKWHWVLTKLN